MNVTPNLHHSKVSQRYLRGINKLTQVEERYYKKEEYDALTQDEKKTLHEKHGKHGHKKSAKDRALPSKFKPKAKVSAKTKLSKHLINAIASAVVEHHSGKDSTGSISSDEELDIKKAPPKKISVSSNCNNSTVQHKQT